MERGMMAHGIPDDNKISCTEHGHDWQILPSWGVFIGASRCKLCGKVARRSDFPHLREDSGMSRKVKEDKYTPEEQIAMCQEPDAPYIASHTNAKRRMKKGQQQVFCETCQRWKWQDQLCLIARTK